MPETATPPATLDLTVLLAGNKIPVRKTMERASDGSIHLVRSYPKYLKYWVRAPRTIPHDIDALSALVSDLANTPDACLVTGEPTGPAPLDKLVRRLKEPKENDPASLAECAAAWLPIDCDKVPLSAPLDPIDPEAAVAEVVSKLGAPFTDCSYCWQLTASATPGADRLSVRLFFLVDQAITNEQRARWGNGLIAQTGVSLVDTHIYSAANIIYTSNAEFRGNDPFPRRTGVVYGEAESVPWGRVPIAESARTGAYQGADFRGTVHRSITEWLNVIGDGEGQEGFHGPIRSAVWAMVYHRWTPDRIRAVIRETVFSADSHKHDETYLRTETCDRVLNASIKGAAQRIQAAMNAPRVTQTRNLTETVSLDVAEKRIRALVSTWLQGQGPARLVIDSTVGAGKTTQTVKTILEELQPGANVMWAFPTHAQGEEVLDRFNRGSLNRVAVRIEGRVREEEGVQPLCAKPHVIRAIKDAALQKYTASIACKRGQEECEHIHGCAYYKQFMGRDRVRLVPHALLVHPEARAFTDSFAGSCTGLVIDESPLSVMVGSKSFKLADVTKKGGVLATVIKAFQDGDDLDAESTIKALEDELVVARMVQVPCCGPGAESEWGLLEELKQMGAGESPRFVSLYTAAITRLQGGKNALWFGKNDEGADLVLCAWKNRIPEFERVLVLDGTADHEVYKALLGDDVHIERIHVEQNLEIIQATDTPLGKRRLTDPEGRGVLAQAVALARATGAGLITNLSAIEIAKEKGYLPDEYPLAHFNALRGVNHLEHLDAIVIAGRPEPSARDVEKTARALWPEEDLTLTGGYVWRCDGLASVASHPDSRCDGLLRMFREAEILQAIGRLRAVRSKKRKTVYLLTHTPTGLPVTSRAFSEIVPPVSLSRLLLAGGGVAPLAPALMVQMVPGLWASEKSAEDDIRRNLKPALPLYKTLYKQIAGFKFRTTGQKRPSFALSFLDDFDTWQRLEEITGKTVEDCQKQQAETTPAPAEAPPEADELLATNQKLPTSEPTPLIRRSSLYARLMGGRPRADSKFRQSPRNAHPPDWGALVQAIPTFTLDAQLAF